MSLVYLFWAAHIILLPVYVFSSGSMQPSHFFFIFTFVVYVICNPGGSSAQNISTSQELLILLRRKGVASCVLFLLFSLYVTAVNSSWFIILDNIQPLVFAAFQIYNFLLVYLMYRLVSHDYRRFLLATRTGFICALLLVLIAVLSSGIGLASRENGLFNNPNQLAFFCLSACLIFFVTGRLGIGSALVNRLMIAVACFLCLLTLSRAGLVGCFLVFLFSYLDRPDNIKRIATMVFFALIFVAISISLGLSDRVKARNVQTEAVFANQVEGRGYDRILDSPQYILFGAGEGAYKRFSGQLASLGAEIHSSVGTLIFSYGLFGFSLYCGIWYMMFNFKVGFAYNICALTPILYGVTHNGLRFSAAIIALMFLAYGNIALQHKNRYGNQAA